MALEMADVITISFKEVKAMTPKLSAVRRAIAQAVSDVQPEFGAYMAYSGFLEEGTKNKDGSLRMAARPHIKRAITSNVKPILDGVMEAMLPIIKTTYRQKQTTPPTNRVEKMWVRILNDVPRRLAVDQTKQGNLDIFEFGFHRRSIRGYAQRRSAADITAEQSNGNSARRAKALAKSKKKRKKKTKKKKLGSLSDG